MKRYRYGHNFETSNLGKLQTLVPLGYMEVVPGTTVQGSVATRFISDVTFKPVYTRGYLDVFAFHYPFRLLSDTWADFIRTAGQVGSVETVANAFPSNFEPKAVAHPVWFRRAYNKTWNSFFRSAVNPVTVNEDQVNLLGCEYRKSTFAESITNAANADLQEQTIPVDTLGGGVSVDDIREGFLQDRMRKLRGYYGSKYTDFLGSLGVEAGWSILEEGEVVGRKSVDLVFRTTKGTYQGADPAPAGSSPLGAPGGQWEAHVTLPLKRTFCPEHGLIAFFGVARVERYNYSRSHPLLQKMAVDDYWAPERAYQRYKDASWILGTNTLAQTAYVLPFEEHRKGINLAARPAGLLPADQYGNNYNDDDEGIFDIIAPPNTVFDSLFQGYLGDHYQVFNQFRLIANSPVKPDVRNIGVQ